MKKLGIYNKKTKINYVSTKPILNDTELVMYFNDGNKTIKNQIMQKWETQYMKRLADVATKNGGVILEVGFGMGISANFIQKNKKVITHHIVECHPVIIKLVKKRYKKELKNGKIILHEGFWEDVVKSLPPKSFDGILFDSCPLDKEVEFFQFFPFFNAAYKLLKDDGVFTYFSDEPLNISLKHRKSLLKSGFKNISYSLCKVKPPENCLYWNHSTIVVPIVKKI